MESDDTVGCHTKNISIYKIGLKIIYLRIHSNLPGANELKYCKLFSMGPWSSYEASKGILTCPVYRMCPLVSFTSWFKFNPHINK